MEAAVATLPGGGSDDVSGGAAAGALPEFSLFVGDLAPDVSDFLLQESFRQWYPSVHSAKVITDPTTGRSKGYGFVRFASEPERDRALEMQGFNLSGRPIRVSLATARRAAGGGGAAAALANAAPHPADLDPTNTTLFIGGLGGGVTEEQLRAVFAQYGDIVYTKVPAGKGCGFVQYVQRPSAEMALAALNGQVLGGGAIRISWGRSTSRAAGAGAGGGARDAGGLEFGAGGGGGLLAGGYGMQMAGGGFGGAAMLQGAGYPQAFAFQQQGGAAMAKPLPGQPMLVQPGLSGMQLGLPGMQQQMQQQVAMQQQMAVAGGHMGGGGGAGMFSGYGLAGAGAPAGTMMQFADPAAAALLARQQQLFNAGGGAGAGGGGAGGNFLN